MKYIRQWVAGDACDLAVALNNRNIQDNLRDGLPLPYTEKDAMDYINSVLSAPENTQYAWAIHASGKAIGSIGIFRNENVHRLTAEMGYYVAEPYWGQGFASNAIKEASDFVFTNTDIVRVYAEPYAHNIGSCRALEKAGFLLEGVMKSNAIKNGKLVDMKLYARIR